MNVFYARLRSDAMRAGAAVRASCRIPRPARSFTLRELATTLQGVGDARHPVPVQLTRLMALVSADLAMAIRHPGHRGGPDTMRTLGAWRSRYNHLDRYLPRG